MALCFCTLLQVADCDPRQRVAQLAAPSSAAVLPISKKVSDFRVNMFCLVRQVKGTWRAACGPHPPAPLP